MELSRAATSNVSRGTQPLTQDLRQSELAALITDGMQELGFSHDPETNGRLLELTNLLSSWAPRINLTGHRNPETVVRRLVLDAAAISLQLPDFSTFSDVGSGAGFPGIPLAILRPDARLSSIEPREKRVHFQRTVVRELAIRNVEIQLGRSEDLSPTSHDLVIAQALAKPARALDWMLPWARAGGWIAIPTGRDVATRDLERDPRIEDVTSVEYRVPLGGPLQQLLLARRAD